MSGHKLTGPCIHQNRPYVRNYKKSATQNTHKHCFNWPTFLQSGQGWYVKIPHKYNTHAQIINSHFVTAYDDACIFTAKVQATSRRLQTVTCPLFFLTVFYPCSSTFLSIHVVSRSDTFWVNSTCIVIHNVLRFSSGPLGIVLRVILLWFVALQLVLVAQNLDFHIFVHMALK